MNDVPVGLSFSTALILLKEGERVARSGWNGKNMFIFLVPGSTFKVSRAPLLGTYSHSRTFSALSFCQLVSRADPFVRLGTRRGSSV